MNTGQQCAESVAIRAGTEVDATEMVEDADGKRSRMTPADVIYRVATVTAVLYLLVSIF